LKNRESTVCPGAEAGISHKTRHVRRRRPGRCSPAILYQISLDGASELPGIGVEFPATHDEPTLSAAGHGPLNCGQHSEMTGFLVLPPASDRHRPVDGKSSHAAI
jgi:hypothetical protein